jgi:hypothetical protein
MVRMNHDHWMTGLLQSANLKIDCSVLTKCAGQGIVGVLQANPKRMSLVKCESNHVLS